MSKKLTTRTRPEARIQADLKRLLVARGWYVEQTHGSMYQVGLPDLYISRPDAGQRWIDCKVEGRYSFTRAQRIKWPKWEAAGIGIWILVAATTDEYEKLFGPPNWRDYWKDSWAIPDPDDAIDEALRIANETPD